MRPTQRDTLQLRIEQALMRASILDAELTRHTDAQTRREIREARQSWRDEARRLQGKLGRLDRRMTRA